MSTFSRTFFFRVPLQSPVSIKAPKETPPPTDNLNFERACSLPTRTFLGEFDHALILSNGSAKQVAW